VPTSGGITQARQRLGYEPMMKLFAEVAAPVAEELTAGAFLGPWRLMAIDGLSGTPGHAGERGGVRVRWDGGWWPGPPGVPEGRVARGLYRGLEDDGLLIADRNFFNWADWCTAADTGAQLLWRVKADLTLPALALLPEGSYSSVPVNPKIRGKAREAVLEAARGGKELDEGQARYVRVVEYEVPDRDGDGKGEVIALVTAITEMTAAAAPLLSEAYHQRWEHETGNAQLKTSVRAPERAAVQEPGHGPPGDLRLPAHALRPVGPDLPGGHRSGHRPGPGQVQADRPHRPPPGRRPGGLST
jgi:hypothetical protein